MKEKIDIKYDNTCPECGGNIIDDYDRGERVCERCGLVCDDVIIDQHAEYRTFEDSRTTREHYGPGESYLYHDKGLSTEISVGNRDYSGKRLSHKNTTVMYRLRKLHHQVRMSHAYDRSIINANRVIVSMAGQLYLPKEYCEQASLIYRKAIVKNLIRGRSVTGVAAACVYAVCRRLNTPRTLDEIASAACIGRKEVGRTYRFLAKKLKLYINPARPEDYLPRFSSMLGIRGDTQAYALQLLERCRVHELMTGRGPIGVAASAIYIATVVRVDGGYEHGDHITQKKIAEVTGITEVTIRNRYKEMVEELDLIDFKEKFDKK